jgi:hypothetical protein
VLGGAIGALYGHPYMAIDPGVSGDVFGGGVLYLDPEGQVECDERLSLPKPRRAQKETIWQKEMQIVVLQDPRHLPDVRQLLLHCW